MAGIGPETGAGGGSQRSEPEGGKSGGQGAGSGSVERPLQCETEVGAGDEEERTEGERTGPRSASGASRFGFEAEKAHPGLMKPGFGSGTQRSGSGFEAPEAESETGTLGQSETLQ